MCTRTKFLADFIIVGTMLLRSCYKTLPKRSNVSFKLSNHFYDTLSGIQTFNHRCNQSYYSHSTNTTNTGSTKLPTINFDNEEINNKTDDCVVDSNLSSPSSIKDCAHWVIPNKMMIGELPNNEHLFNTLINQCNINLFISLVEDGFDSYPSNYSNYSNFNKNKNIKFESFPIEDFGIANDENVIQFIEKTVKYFIENENEHDMDIRFYIHCLSGHGRTGTITPLFLMALYGCTSKQAINWINYCHSARHLKSRGCVLPETDQQLKQVERLQTQMVQIFQSVVVGSG